MRNRRCATAAGQSGQCKAWVIDSRRRRRRPCRVTRIHHSRGRGHPAKRGWCGEAKAAPLGRLPLRVRNKLVLRSREAPSLHRATSTASPEGKRLRTADGGPPRVKRASPAKRSARAGSPTTCAESKPGTLRTSRTGSPQSTSPLVPAQRPHKPHDPLTLPWRHCHGVGGPWPCLAFAAGRPQQNLAMAGRGWKRIVVTTLAAA